MKGLKVSLCVDCCNDCLRIELLCRPDYYLHCWRNHFEVENFSIFWLIIENWFLFKALRKQI
jgi:hypothetical protein